MTQAIPVEATASFFDTTYPVQSVSMVKQIGSLAACRVGIQLTGATGQPLSGDEITEFARDFNARVLDKTDTKLDARVEASAGTSVTFAGVVTGCAATISAAGHTQFSVSMIERNRLLASMNMNVYPSNVPLATRSGQLFEGKHPYVREANPTGSIAARIRALYDAAKNNYRPSDSENPLDLAREQQRETNTEFESVLFECLDASNMNPEWLEQLDDEASVQLNDRIAHLLFARQLNVWDALLQIANVTNLVYVGGFESGGHFRELDLKAGGNNLAANPVSTQRYQLGLNSAQSVGQVIAAAEPTALGQDVSTRTGTARGTLVAAGRWPEKPAPKAGKIVVVTAPTWFTVAHDVNTDTPDDQAGAGNTLEQVNAEAAEWLGKTERVREKKLSRAALIELWCRDRYRVLRTKNVRASVEKPFASTGAQLAAPASSDGLEGVLNSVEHTLSVTGQGGTARTVYHLAYIQPGDDE